MTVFAPVLYSLYIVQLQVLLLYLQQYTLSPPFTKEAPSQPLIQFHRFRLLRVARNCFSVFTAFQTVRVQTFVTRDLHKYSQLGRTFNFSESVCDGGNRPRFYNQISQPLPSSPYQQRVSTFSLLVPFAKFTTYVRYPFETIQIIALKYFPISHHRFSFEWTFQYFKRVLVPSPNAKLFSCFGSFQKNIFRLSLVLTGPLHAVTNVFMSLFITSIISPIPLDRYCGI